VLALVLGQQCIPVWVRDRSIGQDSAYGIKSLGRHDVWLAADLPEQSAKILDVQPDECISGVGPDERRQETAPRDQVETKALVLDSNRKDSHDSPETDNQQRHENHESAVQTQA
jgi:hypothetical protein